MNGKATALGLLAFVLAAAPGGAQRSATAKETTAEALKRKLDQGEKVLVIDVRTDAEVKSGTIPGAVHVPLDELAARLKDVPRDVQLVFT
jgi:rhodanese-related sulfurtransferase